MIDCNNVENFFHELKRMCKSTRCEDCGTSNLNNSKNMNCGKYIKNFPKEAVAIVQAWSDEHPQKTFLSDFFEKHPKAQMSDDGTPLACAKEVGYETKTCSAAVSCKDCWGRPLTEDNE